MNRRIFVAALIATLSGEGAMAQAKPIELGQRFRILDGDGDQSYFSKPMVLRLIDAPWFHGRVLRGEALLFQVEHGPHEGEFIAVTARTLAPLRAQIEEDGWASVVVHRINNPTASFGGSGSDAFPFGMSFIERLEGDQLPA